jgi:vacuolar-type H+-ATPase subunit E/Vma4
VALEHLIAALEKEAEAHRAAELAAAREEAARVEAEEMRRVGRMREEALQELRLRLQQDTDQLVAGQRRQSRQEVLLARHRLLERIRHRALELMPETVRSQAYLGRLPEELADALSYLAGSKAIVRCSPPLAAAIRPRVAERPQLTLEEDSDLAPGFQVAAADGSVLVDRTLPRRLISDEVWLRLEILREVGGREAPLG